MSERAESEMESPSETATTEVLGAPEVLGTTHVPDAPEAPGTPDAPGAPDVPEHPTVRWGALVWALIFAAVAGTTLWVLVSPERRESAAEFLGGLGPVLGFLYGVAALGVVLALFGVVGLIRRGERARRTRRA